MVSPRNPFLQSILDKSDGPTMVLQLQTSRCTLKVYIEVIL